MHNLLYMKFFNMFIGAVRRGRRGPRCRIRLICPFEPFDLGIDIDWPAFLAIIAPRLYYHFIVLDELLEPILNLPNS